MQFCATRQVSDIVGYSVQVPGIGAVGVFVGTGVTVGTVFTGAMVGGSVVMVEAPHPKTIEMTSVNPTIDSSIFPIFILTFPYETIQE